MSELDIAIIGMSCRFPGSKNTREFWKNIKNGAELIRFYRYNDLLKLGVDVELLKNPNYVGACGSIDGIDQFDADFFNYTCEEAILMDPQIRILHETCWEALEDGGYYPGKSRNRIGLYVGAASNILWRMLSFKVAGSQGSDQFNASILNDKDFIASRISYNFNLSGPSYTIDTACSTSLVTIHEACQALIGGECDMALAGGATIALNQNQGYLYQEGFILSSDGHCRTFDGNANGTVEGNGAGIVLLKPLDDALKDRDNVYAVIKASAVNNDGSRKVGYTAPSVEGQAEVIRVAHHLADIDPETLSYIEAHGTGTRLGDPIEIEALKVAFNTGKKGYCAIGSVKTNLGHLDRAAGIAGFIKTVLALNHKCIPPSLNFEKPNPNIDFESSPFYINNKLTQWGKGLYLRRAAVNSMGIGGTNAYVVLEEICLSRKVSSTKPYKLVLFSGNSEAAVCKTAQNLSGFLQSKNDIDISDVAYTTQVGRKELPYRNMVVCRDSEDAIASIRSLDKAWGPVVFRKADQGSLFAIFPGEGEQYVNMGLDLYRTEPVFRNEMERCFTILREITGLDYKHILYPVNAPDNSLELIDKEHIDPVLLSFEYSVAKLLNSWDIHGCHMLGIGIGEYVIAHLLGVISLEEVLYLALHRSNADKFRQYACKLKLQEPEKPYISSVSGTWVSPGLVTNPQYWIEQLNTSIYFDEDIKELLKSEGNICIEVAPGQFSYFTETNISISLFAQSYEKGEEYKRFINGVGRLWLNGFYINWKQFSAGQERNRVSLPAYPFERKSYWIEGSPLEMFNHKTDECSEIKKNNDISKWFYYVAWKNEKLNITFDNNKSNYIVFSDNLGIGDAIIKKLQANGNRTIVVNIGSGFLREGNGKYYINPQSPHEYELLFTELSENGLLPDKAIHLWNLSNTVKHEVNVERIQKAQVTGFYSLLYIIQALAKTIVSDKFDIKVITNNMFDVVGEDLYHPEKATLKGICCIAPQENPNITCSCLDIPIDYELYPGGKTLNDTLYQEISSQYSSAITAYRGRKRWIPVFESLVMDKKVENIKATKLKQNGIYLITGGLGKIGIALGEYLARNYKAKLILTGRTQFPARDQWDIWIDKYGKKDGITQKIQKIRDFEAAGAEVLIFSADSSNKEEMANVLSISEKAFGLLNGVIHAAGITEQHEVIESLEPEACEKHFASKVYSLAVLENILKNRKLDFCVLMSSISSILGGLGMSAYAAGNAFMDAFVHYQNYSSKTQWICINWDGWNLGSKEMIAWETSISDLEINIEEGIRVFEKALLLGEEHIIISTGELQSRQKQWQINRHYENKAAPSNEVMFDVLQSRPNFKNSYISPRNYIEGEIFLIWQKYLKYERIGIDDDFFELGGNSLKAISVISAIHKSFNKKIGLSQFLKNPTIRQVADFLNNQNQSLWEPVKTSEIKEYYPLSSNQKRMYISSNINTTSTNYNLPFVLQLIGVIDKDRIETCFQVLVKRHESLRTAFVLVDNTPVQKIVENVPFKLEYSEITTGDENTGKIYDEIYRFIRPFDLSNSPLIRANLVKIEENDHYLMIDIHHIISDGVSIQILMDEFMALYEGKELPELKFQYRDYSEWQQQRGNTWDIYGNQESFWLNEFAKGVPLSNIPTDFERPKIPSFEGEQLYFELDEETTMYLKDMADANNITLFTYLLSLFYLLLNKIGGSEEIVIGTSVAGRTHSDMENIVGLFLNYLPLKKSISQSERFIDFLIGVNKIVMDAFENQDYPFDDLIEKLKLSRDINRNPLYDMIFIFQNVDIPDFKISNLIIKQFPFKNRASKLDINIEGFFRNNKLYFIIEYNVKLFKEETIKIFSEYFVNIARNAVRNPENKIEEILNWMDSNYDKILGDFNEDLEVE
ncbi:hypothetical protein acsn021_37410 [Anaerocolumna cellulosilytica]|uniref:Uncharacterized protein n=1 Tax=Anaerocolumna cellulosilytica TaxID=433286 RepID=A0A6S6RA80_9FIRM|nr:type I polyketide synthase [Anaerocolumna cellulosilytica]MBB5194991.1 polyketide synthase PksN [Anaerocolumna cellulosilytica]BCJ96172.1 hypothetical protein acsn021_37410 [Anaerocolumna cellulosilytica]